MPGRSDYLENNPSARGGGRSQPKAGQPVGSSGALRRNSLPPVAGKTLAGWKRAVFKKAGLVK